MGCVHGKYCCCFCCCRPSTSDENEGPKDSGARRILGEENRPLIENSLLVASVPSHNLRLEYAFLTQQGHYPDSPDRENQDCLSVEIQVQGNPDVHFFGVFDGHGQFGTQCSNFVKDRLFKALSSNSKLLEDPVRAYASAFEATNLELHGSDIDDSMSGTTAITILVIGDTLYVANVGDSRAVAGVWDGSSIVAKDLSSDQTPFRKDEYERVKQCGARVLSVDQVEGVKDPSIQCWGEEDDNEGDPPRLWVQDGMYPGTAFTRSVGDSTAEKIGVTAEPEVLAVKITADHLFFIIASDGIFEFLSSQAVVDMVAQYEDPRIACSELAAESYKIWLEHESRTDDITIIVVHIKDECHSDAASASASAADGLTHGNNKNSLVVGEMQTAGGSSLFLSSSNEESSSQMQSCPVDSFAERSACVAPISADSAPA